MIMKKLIFIAICFISLQLFAQGNLQFNRVVNETLTGNFGGYYTAGTITVPAGKVWKIEAASVISLNNTTIGTPDLGGAGSWMGIGNHPCYYYNAPNIVHLPLWLSAGTYDVGGKRDTAEPIRIVISAIEFNVVP
jgi:hypothetical protein